MSSLPVWSPTDHRDSLHHGDPADVGPVAEDVHDHVEPDRDRQVDPFGVGENRTGARLRCDRTQTASRPPALSSDTNPGLAAARTTVRGLLEKLLQTRRNAIREIARQRAARNEWPTFRPEKDLVRRARIGGGVRDSQTGCGAAWLARLLWEQEVAGSNPAIPTNKSGLRPGCARTARRRWRSRRCVRACARALSGSSLEESG